MFIPRLRADPFLNCSGAGNIHSRSLSSISRSPNTRRISWAATLALKARTTDHWGKDWPGYEGTACELGRGCKLHARRDVLAKFGITVRTPTGGRLGLTRDVSPKPNMAIGTYAPEGATLGRKGSAKFIHSLQKGCDACTLTKPGFTQRVASSRHSCDVAEGMWARSLSCSC